MPTAVTRQRRAVRAAAFGAVLTGGAVLAHALAGGMVPAAGVIAGAAAVLCVLGWALAGRDRSAAALAATALVGQAGLHLTFSLAMPGPMSMSSLLCGRPAPGVADPGTALMRARLGGSAASATSQQMLLMVVAHALGAVAVLLALRSAEAVAAVIAGVLTAVLLWALPAGPMPAARRRFPTGPVFRVRTSALFVVSPRRGPPVSLSS